MSRFARNSSVCFCASFLPILSNPLALILSIALSIADLAMVGGLNSQKNEKVASNAKMATFEMAEKMYEKMIEMAKKGKNVRYEATRDTSYINTKNMEKKGLIEVISDEEDRFSDSDIEMNNVVITPNVEALEEELKKVRETLRKLREKELCTIKVNSESGEQSR